MMENEEDFEKKKLKIKMNEIIKISEKSLKEKYYRRGIKDELPTSWNEFKEFVIDHCTGESIDNVFKYENETWLAYLKRLYEWSRLRNLNEEIALRRMRTQWLPRDLRTIMLSFGITMKIALERFEEVEKIHSSNIKPRVKKECLNNRKIFKDDYKVVKTENTGVKKNVKNIKCFKCGDVGHFANKCTNKAENEVNNIYNAKEIQRLDMRFILLNGEKMKALFDSGATNNIISRKIIKKMPEELIFDEEKKFKLIDGTEFTTHKAIKLQIEYNDRRILEKFNIIDNDGKDVILSNKMINGLLKKKIPIK